MSTASLPASERASSKEVLRAIWRCRAMFAGVGLFTALINILALTGSLYMLQVYDRVIPSHSVPTLVGLTLLMFGLYVTYGVLDFIRTRVLVRIGLRLDKEIRGRVFACVLELPLRIKPSYDPLLPLRDLDLLRTFISGPGPTALFDAPWMPLYLGFVFLLHPWLGVLASAGAGILILLTVATEYSSRRPLEKASRSASERQAVAEGARRYYEVAHAMGFAPSIQRAWLRANDAYLKDQTVATDATGALSAISRVFRLLLQSAVLGLGALLVIRGEASGGVMIAASILTSRALAPIEIAIANWRGFISARQARQRLEKLMTNLQKQPVQMKLPPPRQKLSVENLWVAAPGATTPILQDISFTLEAGAGLGIIGPSASGKTSLARALVGVWSAIPNRGVIRLDGAAIGQWQLDELGRHIGYVPQDLQLYDGTIFANIARHAIDASSEEVIRAARAAGAHELIVKLPGGYDTQIGEGGSVLSAGQRQRIALARALFGDPFLIVLDEPNSNLDAEGEQALAEAIAGARKRGAIVIVVAHRPAALSSLDDVLVLAGGRVRAFGPKEPILRSMTQAPQAQPRTGPLKVITEGAG